MAKANKRDYDGAIADYSAAIRAPDIPTDVKAMAIYNRSLAYHAIHEDAKAAEDLAALLEMPGLSERMKKEAHQRRERIQRRDDDNGWLVTSPWHNPPRWPGFSIVPRGRIRAPRPRSEQSKKPKALSRLDVRKGGWYSADARRAVT